MCDTFRPGLYNPPPRAPPHFTVFLQLDTDDNEVLCFGDATDGRSLGSWITAWKTAYLPSWTPARTIIWARGKFLLYDGHCDPPLRFHFNERLIIPTEGAQSAPSGTASALGELPHPRSYPSGKAYTQRSTDTRVHVQPLQSNSGHH